MLNTLGLSLSLYVEYLLRGVIFSIHGLKDKNHGNIEHLELQISAWIEQAVSHCSKQPDNAAVNSITHPPLTQSAKCRPLR